MKGRVSSCDRTVRYRVSVADEMGFEFQVSLLSDTVILFTIATSGRPFEASLHPLSEPWHSRDWRD